MSGPSVASATNVTGSNFEADDGNLVVNGASPALDWLNRDNPPVLTPCPAPPAPQVNCDIVTRDLPTGQTDDSFTGGTKNDSAVPTVDTGSVPNNKSDLTNFGTNVEANSAGTFVNVFWTRVQDPNGTTAMDFEFNQLKTNANNWGPQPPPYYPNEVIPQRKAGDLLLTYELAAGGTKPTLMRRTWVVSGSTGSWSAATIFNDSQAIGSINTVALTAAQTGGTVAAGGLGALSARTFGEATFNLNLLVPDPTGTNCETFGSVYVKSRASDVLDEELKDFIAPQPVAISNCGKVVIHKTDDHGAALAGAQFTLYNNVAPLTPPVGAGDTATTLKCTTDANGDCTIINVPKGDYLAHETVTPDGYDSAPDQAFSITAGDQEVDLTFVDPIQTGTITVIKDAVPNDAQDFTFSLTGPKSYSNAFSLDDDSDATLPNTRSFTVPVGTYSLSETNIPSGWVNTDLVCTGDGTDGSVAKPLATIALDKGEHVTCTYTDTFTKLDVNLQTAVANVTPNVSWNDGATLTGDGTHPVTGHVDFFVCGPTPSAQDCTAPGDQVGGDATVSGSGSAFHATTTVPFSPTLAGNYCFRAVFHSDSGFYADSTQTAMANECFLKRNANLTVSKTAVAAFGRVYHWTIQKDVDQTHVDIAAGGTATFHYSVTVGNTHTDSTWNVTGKITVTNPNNVAFTGVNVTDAIDNGAGSCSVVGGSGAVILANSSKDFDYTCTYSSAPSPAFGTNTATATWNGTTFFTTNSSATGTATVDFSQVTPSTTDESITVTDTNSPNPGHVLGVVSAGDTNPTTFTYSVTRSGVAGTCTQYDNTATFTSNDSATTGHADKSVVVCVGSNLQVTKTATAHFGRDDLWTITKDVDKTSVNIAAGGTATFNYSVTVTPNGFNDSGYTLSGSIHVVNPNDWEDIVANVTDSANVGGGVSCSVTGGSGVTIPKGSSVDLPYTCTFSGTPTNGTNTATATWNATTFHTPAGTASGTAPVNFTAASETHKVITVVDDKTNPAAPVTLGTWDHASGSVTFHYSLEKQGVAGTCTSYTNTAVIFETQQSASKTVTVCVGSDLTVTKTALATDHRTYLWNINKDVDQTRITIDENGTAHFHYTVTATPNGFVDDGWHVTGTIVVKNPNNWESVSAHVADSLDTGGGASCSFGGASPDVVIPPNSAVTLNYVCSFDSEPSDGTNTATATWDKAAAATPTGSATGTASVVFVPSSQTNQTITVVDDKTDPANPVTLGQATWGENPTTFTYTVDKTGVAGTCTDYTNTATISETEQTASKTVTVCVGSGLVVSASAAASFDRTYLWAIDKSVDNTLITNPNGNTGTFNYTVKVSPNGIVDSNYQMGGSVTVSNPNDWESIVTTVTVASDVGGGVDCAVTGGADVSIPASGQVTVPYTCTFATPPPATTGTNTATATWDSEAASTATDSADATVPVEFNLNSETNKTITVVDDKTDPAHPVTLGTVTYTDGATTFTYALTQSGTDATTSTPACVDYTNIASIVETEQSDSQLVTLCHTFTGGGGTPVVTPPSGGGLPFTGDAIGLLVRVAAGLLGAGLVLLLISRKRRQVA